MNWFTWRQHRKQFFILGILLVLYAAVLIPTGLHYWHAYQQTLTSCKQNPATPSCSNLSSNLFQTSIDQIIFRFVPATVLLLPVILGIFWGGPLVASEYAEGTNKLVWTQGISRRKWLTVKLAWIMVATAVFMGAFAALITWWSNTPNSLGLDRFSSELSFNTQGIVPVTYALFAVALGIMIGAWTRKTMVAVGVVLGLFMAMALIVVPSFLRPHFMAPVTITTAMGPDELEAKIPQGAWVIKRNIVDKSGNAFNSFNLVDMPTSCQQIIQQSEVGTDGHGVRIKTAPATEGGDPIDACLNNAGYHQVAAYQPSYRYWDFQRIEAGMYLGMTALFIGATYYIVLKRDA